MFILALFMTAKKGEQLKCPSIDKWKNKMWSIHIMKYYLTIKKNKILIHGTMWMDLKNIMVSMKCPQSETE